MDQVVRSALEAIERQDRTVLKAILHPYLHWKTPGVTLRGRTNVLAHLAEHPLVSSPSSYELRDGQIYRWTSE